VLLFQRFVLIVEKKMMIKQLFVKIVGQTYLKFIKIL